MKLSFVIPAYNEEDYLGDCIDSILREAKGKDIDYEIIVVNNASTDGTKKVAQKYKNVKIVDEPKKGLVAARRAGYSISNGDIIANVDSDSRLTPGWIDIVINEFENDPKLAGISGPFIFYDLGRFMKLMVKLFYYYAFSLYLFNTKILRRGSMLQGGNFAIRRKPFEEVGGYDEKKYSFYGEDAHVAMKLYKVGKVKWTFDLPMYSSGRRIAAEGPFTMMLRYTMNYIWVLFFQKPFTKDFSDFRFKKEFLSIRPRDPRHEWISGIFTIITLIVLPLVLVVLIIYLLSTTQGPLKQIIR